MAVLRLSTATASAIRRQKYRRAAAAVIALGAALRIYLASTLPVGYDEVYVMGLGFDAMSTSTAATLIEVPMTRSTAVAPLWWWVQYAPRAVMSDLSLIGLRVLPVGLGIATLWLAWRCAAARFGRRCALMFLAFVALSDILIFTNSRGEFSESLAVPLMIIAVCLAGRPGQTLARGGVWALLLLIALVKGIFVVGAIVLAEGCVALARPGMRGKRLARLALSLLLAVVPIGLYLAWGSAHFSGQTILHDALEAHGVGELIRALVFDYTTIKAHVTGSMRDAAFVALDFDVWPITVMTTPLLVACVAWSVFCSVRSQLQGRSRRAVACNVLTIWALIGAIVVVTRGTLAARFHLMYLPAAWMVAAIVLARPRRAISAFALLIGVALWSAYVGLGAAWLDWDEPTISVSRWITVAGVLLAIGALVLGLAVRSGKPIAELGGISAILLAVLVLCIAGPISWAPFARFEPMPRGDELALLDACRSGREAYPPPLNRTLYIDLANYYLGGAPDTPESREWALYYARLEAERVPDDPRAWFYVGEALLRTGGDWREVRAAWRRSLELAPNEQLAKRLAQLEAVMQSEGR